MSHDYTMPKSDKKRIEISEKVKKSKLCLWIALPYPRIIAIQSQYRKQRK